ncbi:integration host factor subunit alpha [Alphaproteobacteria bacterium]|nr:integration host factor subunit alpha [Alphaproteobacteria bacterium]
MTITRAHLSEAVYKEVGLSRNESTQLVETVLHEIENTLVSGKNVKISSFGSFYVREKSQRIGRNPKTGEEVPILPRRVLVFRPSDTLRNRVNKVNEIANKQNSISESRS